MKPFGTIKKTGRSKASGRVFDVNSQLTQEDCITKTYTLQGSEYFFKPTTGGNLFVYNNNFEGYVTRSGIILRQTNSDSEFDFVDQDFEQDWDVVNLELKEQTYLVRLSDYTGCYNAILDHFKNNRPRNAITRFIFKRIKKSQTIHTLPSFIYNKPLEVQLSSEQLDYFQNYTEAE